MNPLDLAVMYAGAFAGGVTVGVIGLSVYVAVTRPKPHCADCARGYVELPDDLDPRDALVDDVLRSRVRPCAKRANLAEVRGLRAGGWPR